MGGAVVGFQVKFLELGLSLDFVKKNIVFFFIIYRRMKIVFELVHGTAFKKIPKHSCPQMKKNTLLSLKIKRTSDFNSLF